MVGQRTTYRVEPVHADQWVIRRPTGDQVGGDFYRSPELAAEAVVKLAQERGRKAEVIYSPEGKPVAVVVEAQPREMTITLSPDADELLSDLAYRLQASEGTVMVWGLGLLKAALDAQAKGKKLVILSRDGRPETEIVPQGAR